MISIPKNKVIFILFQTASLYPYLIAFACRWIFLLTFPSQNVISLALPSSFQVHVVCTFLENVSNKAEYTRREMTFCVPDFRFPDLCTAESLKFSFYSITTFQHCQNETFLMIFWHFVLPVVGIFHELFVGKRDIICQINPARFLKKMFDYKFR